MTHFIPVYWIIFAILFIIIAFCDLKFNMLRDISSATSKPYSWSRVQLAWWMLIIMSSFITIIICYTGHEIPTLDSSTLILLGITTGTTATASMIDTSDKKKATLACTIQDFEKENFLLDILSDGNGVTIYRLQTVIFNFVFGVWFITYVLENFCNPCTALHPAISACADQPWSYIIPVISNNNLILLGMSSGTYAVLKTGENATPSTTTTAQASRTTNTQNTDNKITT